MTSAPFDVQIPPTEPQIAEAIRVSDPDTADTIRRLAFQRDRLVAFSGVAERLWPYVRYFAMAGANPDAISAVVALGKLLGKPTDADSDTALAAAEFVRGETVKSVTDWLGTSPQVRAKIGSRVAGELSNLLHDWLNSQSG